MMLDGRFCLSITQGGSCGTIVCSSNTTSSARLDRRSGVWVIRFIVKRARAKIGKKLEE